MRTALKLFYEINYVGLAENYSYFEKKKFGLCERLFINYALDHLTIFFLNFSLFERLIEAQL